MLTIEHVRARRDKDRLVLLALSEAKRRRALEIGARLLDEAKVLVGATREDLESSFAKVEVAPAERRLAFGLMKLIEDASLFQQAEDADPLAIRRELFLLAARERRNASLEEPFSRARVVASSAALLALTEPALEECLYADLRGAHRLLRVPEFDAQTLLNRYERAQVQAVLLRAVEVVARVRCKSPDYYRVLFHKLKFRQLLYRLERLPNGDYSIAIDGPFSLFESVTKYGLELAMTLPALEGCDVLELSARVLWGKGRTPLRFEHHHVSSSVAREPEPSLRDEVRALLEDFKALNTPWQAHVADEILQLSGVGLCVPDLVFRHPDSKLAIHLELLGYWSREAVFRRLELVEQGLGSPIVFAASSRLRVSEALFEGEEPAALYVYKGKPSARAVERKLDALLRRLTG